MWRKILLSVSLCVGLLILAFLTWQAYVQTPKLHTKDNPLVARVYDQQLYKSDLDNLTVDVGDPSEKANVAAQYVQSWMAKQLLIAEAEARGGHNKADIERRVLDYRYALLVHNYIEQLVNAQLDRAVTDQAIEAYYTAHPEEFALRYNIFKGRFVVIPREAPNRTKIKKLLTAQGAKNLAALKSYCFQFAKDYSLDEDAWLQWDELIQSTPWNNTQNKGKLLRRSKLLQTSDETYSYYFKINEYRTVNDPAPLAFVRDQVKDIIIYKRKVQLAKKIKEDILKKAKNNDHCTVYEY